MESAVMFVNRIHSIEKSVRIVRLSGGMSEREDVRIVWGMGE